MRLRAALLMGVILASTPQRVIPQEAQRSVRAPIVVETQHTTRISGMEIRYIATVAENVVKGAAGAPAATLVTIAYVRDDVVDRATRPVMFVLPGGPGGSSASLELAAFGPRRALFDGSTQRLTANDASLLDATDLVFIDPIGTGYSDVYPGVDGKQFWGKTSDALSITSVIQEWLSKNGRTSSPRYLLGHSYGTTRATMIVNKYPELDLDGLLLVALVANFGSGDASYVTTLPTFATTAWYHERVDRTGRSMKQAYEDAITFARTDYTAALAQGSALPPTERHRVAERMSALIGLPADFIESNNLRVSKQAFMMNLLRNGGMRTGLLNARATGRLDAPPQPGPYGDPGMPTPVSPELIVRYFQDELGFHPSTTYQSLNLDVNRLWDHEGSTDVSRLIGDAMRQHERMRLFVLAGSYDLTTPAYGATSALARADLPGDRVTTLFVEAGHTISRDERDLAALSEAIRGFVRH